MVLRQRLGVGRRLLSTVLLLAIVRLAVLGAAQKDPTVSSTHFDHHPTKYFYFDDSSVILYQQEGTVLRSDDDGATWAPVTGVPADKAEQLIEHPFDKKTAFVLTSETTHYRTADRGKSWHAFHVDDPPSMLQPPLVFSADNDDYILYIGTRCSNSGGWSGFTCRDHAYYTKNGFEKSPKPMVEGVFKCMFARSTKGFHKDSKKGVFCIDVDSDSSRNWPENLRLTKSEDWFETMEVVEVDHSKHVRGFIGMGSVQSFIVAAVKSIGTEELALYVTDDGESWDRAQFPEDHGGIMEEAYTILPSTGHSIQVDVLTSTSMRNQIGTLFTSNSNGSYFTRSLEYTNRNNNGIVDFEQVQNIQGIILANIVTNHEDVKANPRSAVKEVQSRISFDDGHSWAPLRLTSGDAFLHVHSESEFHNIGLVFSSPAPGIVMGVGNSGLRLKPYQDCDFYVSFDAGLSWAKARDGPHQYEFGDQGGILVAVPDRDDTHSAFYSYDYGKTWKELDLGEDFHPVFLTTMPDSTSETFTLLGKKEEGYVLFSLGFEGTRARKCNLDKKGDGGDFEKWYARYDKDGKPDCLMGHKQFFWRRRQDVDCYVGEKYKDPEPVEENCGCTDEDYECDYNFRRQGDSCILIGSEPILSGQCDAPGDKYTTSSGYRKIPGNTCIEPSSNRKDEPVEKTCGDEGSKNPDEPLPIGEIKHFEHDFPQGQIQYIYLERSETSSGDDETILMHVGESQLFISHDGGREWHPILPDEVVTGVYANSHFKDWVFFVTAKQQVFYTRNRGKDVSLLEGPSGLPISSITNSRLAFHPRHAGWIIWIGESNCKNSGDGDCHTFAQYTKNAGETWHDLTKYVKECVWVAGVKNTAEQSLIYCSQYEDQKGDQRSKQNDLTQLVSSADFFDNSQVKFRRVIGFANLDEYVVVAYLDTDDISLKMAVTVDGEIFANADFPPRFATTRQTAYTVLDSATNSIFLHVTTNDVSGREFGTLMKSNSNGTYYVTSADAVNRDQHGFVDFEKVQGLEGVALVNVVVNVDEVKRSNDPKKLRTKITHNDGGQWFYLTPPEKDSEGKKYDCKGGLDQCSLNLHGYTERKDVRDTYSSGSAVGVLLGVGNVGDSLGSYTEGNTFISDDAGVTWREVHKGPYTWEFGDQGGIIVVVRDDQPTDMVLWSEDQGRTWESYKFSDRQVTIEDIATVPSDTSRKFMLIANPGDPVDRKIIQLDFTGLHDRKCVLDIDNPEAGDFELWTPQNPDPDAGSCLFGHEAQYYRRRVDPPANCYVGSKVPQPHRTLRNCSCTAIDYECDYNFVRGNDRSCQKVGEPIDPMGVCKQEGVIEWFETSGYRKIPFSTCQGGLNLDRQPTKSHPCPGKEDQYYERKRGGLRGWGLAYVILLIFGMAGLAGYIFWKKYADGRFGQIRLGEDASQPFYVRYPLIAVSGVWAAAVLLPDAIVSGWTWVRAKFTRTKRYTSRESFARGGYAALASESFTDAELLDDVEAGEEDI